MGLKGEGHSDFRAHKVGDENCNHRDQRTTIKLTVTRHPETVSNSTAYVISIISNVFSISTHSVCTHGQLKSPRGILSSKLDSRAAPTRKLSGI